MAFKEEILPVRYAMLGWVLVTLTELQSVELGTHTSSQFTVEGQKQQVTDHILSHLLLAALHQQERGPASISQPGDLLIPELVGIKLQKRRSSFLNLLSDVKHMCF